MLPCACVDLVGYRLVASQDLQWYAWCRGNRERGSGNATSSSHHTVRHTRDIHRPDPGGLFMNSGYFSCLSLGIQMPNSQVELTLGARVQRIPAENKGS